MGIQRRCGDMRNFVFQGDNRFAIGTWWIGCNFVMVMNRKA